MNYAELLALSRPGISADGICCYRVSPLEAEQAEETRDVIGAMDAVQDAWVDALPNSQRVCLMWLPSSPEEQTALFDDFVDGEIEKGYELYTSGDVTYNKSNMTGSVLVQNRKTGTDCYIYSDSTANRCYQGQRCGLCKHEVYAVLIGKWENHHLEECIENWKKKKGKVK